MEMAESKLEKWMEELAEEYNVDKELVKGVYYGLQHRRFGMSRKQQTIEFFDLYFKGVNENVKNNSDRVYIVDCPNRCPTDSSLWDTGETERGAEECK